MLRLLILDTEEVLDHNVISWPIIRYMPDNAPDDSLDSSLRLRPPSDHEQTGLYTFSVALVNG